MTDLTRRNLITTGAAVTGALLFAGCSQTAAIAAGPFEVRKTEAEWRRQLGPARYNILREGGTEPPFTLPIA